VWLFERRTDTAAALHGDWPPPGARSQRAVSACSLVGPAALVLGSAQRYDVVDAGRAERAGIDVVRRRSGGGAVLVVPGGQVWLDLWLPRRDPLWDDDVIDSTQWLGDAWARALGSLGIEDLRVHSGRAECTRWSSLVCFGGIGPGEVTAGHAKVVGISQRRSREGARWHTSVPLSWDPAPLVALLALDDHQAAQARAELVDAATGLRAAWPAARHDLTAAGTIGDVEDALVAALP
jgi:lipoate-protein ligase A